MYAPAFLARFPPWLSLPLIPLASLTKTIGGNESRGESTLESTPSLMLSPSQRPDARPLMSLHNLTY